MPLWDQLELSPKEAVYYAAKYDWSAVGPRMMTNVIWYSSSRVILHMIIRKWCYIFWNFELKTRDPVTTSELVKQLFLSDNDKHYTILWSFSLD